MPEDSNSKLFDPKETRLQDILLQLEEATLRTLHATGGDIKQIQEGANRLQQSLEMIKSREKAEEAFVLLQDAERKIRENIRTLNEQKSQLEKTKSEISRRKMDARKVVAAVHKHFKTGKDSSRFRPRNKSMSRPTAQKKPLSARQQKIAEFERRFQDGYMSVSAGGLGAVWKFRDELKKELGLN